jgi:hypothetical protein
MHTYTSEDKVPNNECDDKNSLLIYMYTHHHVRL